MDSTLVNPSVLAPAKFERYVMPELNVLRGMAYSMTRRHHDAEDLVQDTLLRAYRAIDRFDGAHPRAWLVTIMRNTQRNHVKRRRAAVLNDQDPAWERLAVQDSGDRTPEALVVDDSLDPAVAAAVGRLPAKFRAVVMLVDVNDVSYKRAAEILDVPVGTVMSRVHRARRRLRTVLAEKVLEHG